MAMDKAASRRLLATDLDGTLIPLEGDRGNRADLETIKQKIDNGEFSIVFVTGRHLSSVVEAIGQYGLPKPGAIICDVGTTISHAAADGSWKISDDYSRYLQTILGTLHIGDLNSQLNSIARLRRQESEKLGPFKLSYYTDADFLDDTSAQVRSLLEDAAAPCEVIASVDPFNGDGLIDILPVGVTKASALQWWIENNEFAEQDVVFAGDSGNDLAALTAGYRSIVVGNASESLKSKVRQSHEQNGWTDRLHVAEATATSGVLEGLAVFNDR